MQVVLYILFGIICGYIINRLQNNIIQQSKEIVKDKFDNIKFISGMFNISNKVNWAKDIVSLFNIRKIVIYSIIISVIYGYAYYKGKIGKPVEINLAYDKELVIKLDGQELYKPKNSNQLYVRDNKGNIIKVITTKDIAILKEQLKPYKLILEPIVIGGYGLGKPSSKPEAGIGISFFKWFKSKIDAFLTNRGAYTGVSYSITDNSGIGAGIGVGYNADRRVIIYYRWKF